MSSKVVITMPAYRAEGTLAKTLADIPAGLADPIILVDDASPDNTADLARKLGITVYEHPENRGYGGNQKTCYTRALEEGADIVVLLHPDYQYDPKAVPLLVAPILEGYADMTFGSRFAGLSDPRGGGMPLYRYVGNRVTTTLENLMLGSRFSEMHSGLRAYTRACLLSLPFHRYSDDFSFDSQLLVDAVTTGQRVVEVPIPTRYTQESSSISVVRSLKYVAQSLAYCGRQSAIRGRRGRRWPVGEPRSERRQDRDGRRVSQHCVLCGCENQILLYAANTVDDAPASEFRCTSGGLGRHDDILACTRCGMVSSRPKLGADEILQKYEDVVDETYLSELEGRRALFAWVLDVMSGYFVPGRRLLEVGANVGLFLDSARGRGWDVRGIEPSAWAVRMGRERFDVELEQGRIEELDGPRSAADAIVLLDVLEHIVDPLAGLRRLRDLVDDEGVLVLSTINFTGLHARVRKERWPWLIRPHLHYFTPATLRAMLEKSGFRMVEWRVVPRSFHLSYIAERGRSNLGLLGKASAWLSKLVDARVPVGWLGDVVLVVARPSELPGRSPGPPLATAEIAVDDSSLAPRAASRKRKDAPADVEND